MPSSLPAPILPANSSPFRAPFSDLVFTTPSMAETLTSLLAQQLCLELGPCPLPGTYVKSPKEAGALGKWVMGGDLEEAPGP